MFQLEIKHEGLHKYRVIKGETQEIVAIRAEMQLRIWNEQWDRICASNVKREQLEKLIFGRDARKQQAIEQSVQAQKALDELDSLLTGSLKLNHVIDWESLKDKSDYPNPKPSDPSLEAPPPQPVYVPPNLDLKLSWLPACCPYCVEEGKQKSRLRSQ